MERNPINFFTRLKYNAWQVFDNKIGRDKAFKWFYSRRKKLEQKISTQIQQREGKVLDVPVVDFESKAQLQQLMNQNIPLVIKGAANNWNCVTKWSPDYFKNLHGDDEILMIDNSDRTNNQYEQTTLASIIDNINSGGSKYYRFYPLLVRHPEHIADFDYDWLRNNADRKLSNWELFHTFIGGEGTESDTHCAMSSNFFTQCYGKKRWVLVDNKFTPIIDPFPSVNLNRSGNGYLGAPFSFFNPDYESYSNYRHIDYYDVTLEAGDVLYVPPFMYHNVINLTKSIGVAYRWLSYKSAFQSSPLFTALDLTIVNPSFWTCLKMHEKDSNYLHLKDMGLLEQAKTDENLKIPEGIEFI